MPPISTTCHRFQTREVQKFISPDMWCLIYPVDYEIRRIM